MIATMSKGSVNRNGKKRDSMGRFVKGSTAAGRPKGRKNQVTEIRDQLFEAFQKADGPRRLVKLLKDDRHLLAYVRILSQMLPKDQNVNLNDARDTASEIQQINERRERRLKAIDGGKSQ